MTYIGGKSLGVLLLVFTNGVFLIGTYLVKQRIGGEVFSWDLLKACFTMFSVFYFLILFGFVLVLSFGKNAAFFGGLALLVFSTFLDLFIYESVAANMIQTSDLKNKFWKRYIGFYLRREPCFSFRVLFSQKAFHKFITTENTPLFKSAFGSFFASDS